METDHRTSQVTSVERPITGDIPEHPCLGPVDRSPVIFSFCTWTPDAELCRSWKPITLRNTRPLEISDLSRKTGTPFSGFGKPITGDIQFLCMDAPIPDDAEVGNRLLLESDLDRKTGTPLSGSSQVTSVEGLERPCLGLVNRSPVIFSFCATRFCDYVALVLRTKQTGYF